MLKKLKWLSLGDTQITDAGCATLASALDSGALSALTTLFLNGIQASAAAKAGVAEALARSRAAVPSGALMQLELSQPGLYATGSSILQT